MSAKLIDGKALAQTLREDVGAAVAALRTAHGAAPALAVVLVGDDPASQVYVRGKVRQTEAAGMISIERRLPATSTQEEVENTVEALNKDPDVDGILVQLPLPAPLDETAVIEKIDPAKDVDGLTKANAGRLLLGMPGLRPCTPTGCVMLAKQALGDLSGKDCLVIGRSVLVGKPAALLFLNENCTTTIAHSRTRDLAQKCRAADILVAAIGRPNMVQGDWIKPGACVIDVGINRVDDASAARRYRLVGDVDFDAASKQAGHITPVPGGVGPMTIACLLRNTVLAACARRGWPLPAQIQ